MNPLPQITQKQRVVLRFIKRFLDENGRPPMLSEICARFGWSKHNAATNHINALIRHGLLEKTEGLGYYPAGMRPTDMSVDRRRGRSQRARKAQTNVDDMAETRA